MVKKLIKNCKYELKYPYFITDDGRVYSELTNKYLATVLDKNGYVKVRLMSTDGKRHRYSVHRLVMENFKPRSDMSTLQVNHINGDKTNNYLSNLEWVTCQENIQHAMENNLRAEINGAAKLTVEQVQEIIQLLLDGKTNIEIGQRYGVHEDTIGRIRRKKSWKELTKDIDFN